MRRTPLFQDRSTLQDQLLSVDFSEVESVLVDVSSMSRLMMANLFLLLKDFSEKKLRKIYISYSVARYSPPPLHGTTLKIAAPVRPEYAGWSTKIGSPLNIVFGLGYEPSLSISALERLEADRIISFLPEGREPEFLEAVQKENRIVLDQTLSHRQIHYMVYRPANLYKRLTEIISSLAEEERVVLVPFGPKIFAAMCLLRQTFSPIKETSVWRFSSGSSRIAKDAIALGEVVTAQIDLSQTDD